MKSDEAWTIEDFGVTQHYRGSSLRECHEASVVHNKTGRFSHVIIPVDVIKHGGRTMDDWVEVHKKALLEWDGIE